MRVAYSVGHVPPAPVVEIRLGVPSESLSVGPLSALLDAGSDGCIVPFPYIEALGVPPDERKYMRGLWDDRRVVDVYLLDIGIGSMRLPAIEVVGDDQGTEILLGRNVISKLVITLDGPRGVLELRDRTMVRYT